MESLKARLAALREQHKRTAPSFTPSPRHKKVEAVLPDAADLVTDSTDLSTLRELIALHVRYSADERLAKAQKEPVVASLKSICKDYGFGKVTCDQTKVSYYKGTRSTISQQKLLDAGVSLATIKACTIKTESWSVRVTPPGGSDDDGDDEEN